MEFDKVDTANKIGFNDEKELVKQFNLALYDLEPQMYTKIPVVKFDAVKSLISLGMNKTELRYAARLYWDAIKGKM